MTPSISSKNPLRAAGRLPGGWAAMNFRPFGVSNSANSTGKERILAIMRQSRINAKRFRALGKLEVTAVGAQQVTRRAGFDNAAAVQHEDAVDQAAHGGEPVRD